MMRLPAFRSPAVVCLPSPHTRHCQPQRLVAAFADVPDKLAPRALQVRTAPGTAADGSAGTEGEHDEEGDMMMRCGSGEEEEQEPITAGKPEPMVEVERDQPEPTQAGTAPAGPSAGGGSAVALPHGGASGSLRPLAQVAEEMKTMLKKNQNQLLQLEEVSRAREETRVSQMRKVGPVMMDASCVGWL